MYQLVLGVGWNALKTRFQSYDANPQVADWKRIDQHKILLNKLIMEYYVTQAKAEGTNVDVIKTYLSKISNNAKMSEKAKVNGSTLEQVFGNYFAGKDANECALVYSENDSRCSKNKCKNQYDFEEGVFSDNKSMISLHSAANELELFPGDNATLCIEFIKHMIKNEMKICIVDPFFSSNSDSRKIFKNTYLPVIEENAEVNAFVAKEEGDYYWRELKEAAGHRNIKLRIFPCRKAEMHDRCITTSDSVLILGKGIPFYNTRNNLVRETCAFNYRVKPEGKELEYEYRFAGGFVDDPV